MEAGYRNKDLRAAWQVIQMMASFCQHANETEKPICVNGENNSVLPETFNSFFSCFESSDILGNTLVSEKSLNPLKEIVISEEKVTVLFQRVKLRKAAGPDVICEHTLHYCADQLSEVFTRVFQRCADSGKILTMWKTSTVTPIFKTKNS